MSKVYDNAKLLLEDRYEASLRDLGLKPRSALLIQQHSHGHPWEGSHTGCFVEVAAQQT